MMKFAVRHNGPIALRYPRGEAYDGLEEFRAPVELGKWEMIKRGRKIALLAVGSMVRTGWQVWQELAERGEEATFVDAQVYKTSGL